MRFLLSCSWLLGGVVLLTAGGCQPPRAEHVSLLALRPAEGASVSPEVLLLAKTDPLALLREALRRYDALPVRDYTCRFLKREKLRGVLRPPQEIRVKFRESPFSVAMVWTQNASLGDALLYVEGRYRDSSGRSRMLVRPKPALQWLAGKSVLKLPDAPEAMRTSLRPCTEFGFRRALQNLLKVYEQARAAGEGEMRFAGLTDVGGRTCLVLTRVLPKGKDYPAAVTETCLDLETLLPLRIVGYDWDGSLLCDYEYRDVKINPGLTEKDFTPAANGIVPPPPPTTKK